MSLALPDSLLLEVQGSLKLFGGLKAIEKELIEEAEKRHLSFHLCSAPTPLGALWLARHKGADVLETRALAGGLSPLSISVTRWPEAIAILLTEMGVRSVGDCLRLPRDGFARRVGVRYLRELDQALGKLPDLRAGFEIPRSLSWKISFSSETEDLAVFCAALEKIVACLVDGLRSRQGQTQSLELVFHHMSHSPTVSTLGLVEPAHEMDRLLDPLIARLENVVLPAPAIAIGLRAGALQPMEVKVPELFDSGGEVAGKPVSKAGLIERLRGRFGVEGVYGFELVAEHRPELVWAKLTDRLLEQSSTAREISPWAHDRPLWILPSPLLLSHGASRPSYQGQLRMAAEPERIESGWWDGGDIRRDYYTAATARGEKLWVYQDCVTRDWYLHGIFG